MTSNRAPKGGTVGMNGEHYEGGQFLPSTTLEKTGRRNVATTKKARKVEISRREWVEEREGFRSIFQTYGGIVLAFSWTDGFCTVCASDVTLNYYHISREDVQALADRYNAGERWTPFVSGKLF